MTTEVDTNNFTDEQMWGFLTLASLVKKSAEIENVLKGDEYSFFSKRLSAEIDSVYHDFLSNNSLPITKIINLVRAAAFIESYCNTGDVRFLHNAELIICKPNFS